MKSIPNILSIAGADPSGGAGIQADIKAISANGGYAMAAITALTAQNTQGVTGVFNVPADFVTQQLDTVADDVAIAAIKIGMLSSADIIRAVQDFLQRIKTTHNPAVVLDPVMVATSGDRLLSQDAEDAIKDLLGSVDLITPNIPELAVLTGQGPAEDLPTARNQAHQLAAENNIMVFLKGGHLPPDQNGMLTDELISAAGVQASLPTRHIASPNTHGTGCSLSSAIATWYARTGDWAQAGRNAQQWLNRAIAESGLLTVGGSTENAGPNPDPTAVQRTGHGPVHHFTGIVF